MLGQVLFAVFIEDTDVITAAQCSSLLVEGLEGYSYSDRLRLGLTTLETRFWRADLIEVFKILRGFENVDPEKFFQVVRDNGRRGHSFKLFKKRYRLDVGRFKFANQVCEEWNGFDDDVVTVGSMNAFKRKLDPHLRYVMGYFQALAFFLLMAIHMTNCWKPRWILVNPII